MDNFELFQTAYQVATDNQKAIVDSNAISSGVKQLIDVGEIDASQKGLTVSLYALFVLEAIKAEDLIVKLTQAGVPNSTSVVNNLKKLVVLQANSPTESSFSPDTEVTHSSTQEGILANRVPQPPTTPQARWVSE